MSVFGLDNDLLESKKGSQMKARHSESTLAGVHSCPLGTVKAYLAGLHSCPLACRPLFGTTKAHVKAHCTDNPHFLSLSHTHKPTYPFPGASSMPIILLHVHHVTL